MPHATDASPAPVSPADEPSRAGWGRAAGMAFWIGMGVLGVPVGLISLKLVGRTSVAAVLLQGECVLWVVAIGLRVVRGRVAYVVAGVWVVLLWVPVGVQVVRRVGYWVTVGMERPDGEGSPVAFLMGLVVEGEVFVVLSGLLGFLVWARPWRGRAGGGT